MLDFIHNDYTQNQSHEPTHAAEKRSKNYLQIMEHRSLLQTKAAAPVTFSKPLIEREGQGIIYPRTINVVQGKTGVHKSRLVEEFCSVLLAPSGGGQCPLGYRRRSFDRGKLTVLYVDTERNVNDQFPYAIQQIKRKSGHSIEDDVSGFDFISLIGVSREDRFSALKEYLADLRQRTNDHLFIVLDVITDCLSNFNDAAESMRLTDLMNGLINEHDVTFLCVIHENPNEQSSKARGHLGTELSNKASCHLQIGFEKDGQHRDTDLVKVAYLKTRVGRKPDPVYMQYCAQSKGLILADRDLISEVSDSRRTKASTQEVMEELKEVLTEPMPRQDLIAQLVFKLGCGTRTVIDRLKTITDGSITLLNRAGNQCRLMTSKQGVKVVYGLEPLAPDSMPDSEALQLSIQDST